MHGGIMASVKSTGRRPPVRGDAMTIEIRQLAFDPPTELRRYQEQTLAHQGEYGAMTSFIGTMRDVNENAPVRSMMLEHYPGMTEKHLERLVAEAKKNWPIIDALIIH